MRKEATSCFVGTRAHWAMARDHALWTPGDIGQWQEIMLCGHLGTLGSGKRSCFVDTWAHWAVARDHALWTLGHIGQWQEIMLCGHLGTLGSGKRSCFVDTWAHWAVARDHALWTHGHIGQCRDHALQMLSRVPKMQNSDAVGRRCYLCVVSSSTFSTLCASHSTLCASHSTLCASHSTLCASDSSCALRVASHSVLQRLSATTCYA